MKKASGVPRGSFAARPGVDLHRSMIEAAHGDGVSLSTWVNDLCARAVGRLPFVPRTFTDLQKLQTLDTDQVHRFQSLSGGVTIVSGQVSAGKSTLLKVIARQLLERGERIAAIGRFAREYDFVSRRGSNHVQCIDDEWLAFSYPSLVSTSSMIDNVAIATFVNMLNRTNVNTVVMTDLSSTGVYSQIAANLVAPFALTGGKLMIEMHGTSFQQISRRLQLLGVTVSDLDLEVAVVLKRDISLGRIDCETVFANVKGVG